MGKFVSAFMDVSLDRASGSGSKVVFEKSRDGKFDNQRPLIKSFVLILVVKFYGGIPENGGTYFCRHKTAHLPPCSVST